MAENNADIESTNLKIEVDIGGVSYRTELIKEMVNIVPMDQEDENIEVQEMKETVKFYRGEEGVSFSRVGWYSGGEIEFSKSGDLVEDDDVIDFADNWIEVVKKKGFIENDPDYVEIMNFVKFLPYFATDQ